MQRGLPSINVKPVRKFKQVIWLDSESFKKIIELSDQTGLALNAVISEIVRTYLSSGIEPIKVIEKESRSYGCPICEARFNSSGDLMDHMLRSTQCRKKMLEWLK